MKVPPTKALVRQQSLEQHANTRQHKLAIAKQTGVGTHVPLVDGKIVP